MVTGYLSLFKEHMNDKLLEIRNLVNIGFKNNYIIDTRYQISKY